MLELDKRAFETDRELAVLFCLLTSLSSLNDIVHSEFLDLSTYLADGYHIRDLCKPVAHVHVCTCFFKTKFRENQ